MLVHVVQENGIYLNVSHCISVEEWNRIYFVFNPLSKRFKLMKHIRFSNNRLAVKTVIFCCSGAVVMHLPSPKQPTGSRQLIPGCVLLARTDKH